MMIDDPAYLKGLARGRLDAMKELGDMMARLPVEVKAAKSGDEAFAVLAIAWSELGLWGQSAALEAGEKLVLLALPRAQIGAASWVGRSNAN